MRWIALVALVGCATPPNVERVDVVEYGRETLVCATSDEHLRVEIPADAIWQVVASFDGVKHDHPGAELDADGVLVARCHGADWLQARWIVPAAR